MEFSRTEHAAKIDEASSRETKWLLIEAIAQDAVENEVEISSLDSRVAAASALESAGQELSDWTVYDLCVVAKFDYESTRPQREIWRRYGWTSVRTCAKAGISQDAASTILGGKKRLTIREIERAVSQRSNGHVTVGKSTPALDEALRRWINRLDKVLADGALLAERAENEEAELSGHSQLALLIYGRITESKIDAELRELFESEAAK